MIQRDGTPSRKEKNLTDSTLTLHGTAESTSPKVMLHALFVANTASPTHRWDWVRRLGMRLRGPRCEAGVALQSQRLIDQRTRWTRPGGPGGRLGRLLDRGRSRLCQDIDTGRTRLTRSWPRARGLDGLQRRLGTSWL